MQSPAVYMARNDPQGEKAAVAYLPLKLTGRPSSILVVALKQMLYLPVGTVEVAP